MPYTGDIDDFINPQEDIGEQWKILWEQFKVANHDSPYKSFQTALELEKDADENDEEYFDKPSQEKLDSLCQEIFGHQFDETEERNKFVMEQMVGDHFDDA